MKSAQALVLAGMLLAGTSTPSFAASNPEPALFANDTGDSFLFVANTVWSLEIVDQFAGRFGFYFPAAPGTLIELFGTEDQGGLQAGAIDFTLGGVFDLDASNVQSTFSATTDPGPIGFWYSAVDTATGSTYTIYSDPGMNGGQDFFGVFPLLGDPFVTALTVEAPSFGILSLTLLKGAVAPSLASAPVPLPAALPLMLSAFGVAALKGVRRRRRAA